MAAEAIETKQNMAGGAELKPVVLVARQCNPPEEVAAAGSGD